MSASAPGGSGERQAMAVSVVIPLFNEGAAATPLYARLTRALEELPHPHEVILVDDGSTDDTFEQLMELRRADPAVKLIRLSRNFGQQTAISAGLERAAGEFVAVMDADLQDPPELLPVLLARLREGYDVAYAVRVSRREGWPKRVAYRAFYRLLRLVAKIEIPLDAGDFCMMRQQVVRVLNRLPERNRFIRGLRSWVGFRQIGVPYHRTVRADGGPKYTWGKLLRLSLDGLVSFSDLPLRLASYLGLVVSAASFAGILVVLSLRLFTDRSTPGFASQAIVTLFLGGIQLLTIGVLGEYVSRISDEVKQRPLYIASALIGWDEPVPPVVTAHVALLQDGPGSAVET